MTTVTIPKEITRGDELIVLKRKEYEKLQRRLEEIADALAAIRVGEEALRKGRVRQIKSLKELL